VVEGQGTETEVVVQMALPVRRAAETDLLGRKTGEAPLRDGRLAFRIQPWKIRTFEVD
jgi:alpha-mannosidase